MSHGGETDLLFSPRIIFSRRLRKPTDRWSSRQLACASPARTLTSLDLSTNWVYPW